MIPPMQVNKSVSSLGNFRSQTAAPVHTKRYRALRCIICTVIILSVGALAAGGAIIVRQYNLSRAYSSATCRVINITYADDAKCTFCEGTVEKGRDKDTVHACEPVSYPCVRVVVEFVVGAKRRRVGHGVLYDDSKQASGDEARCSLSVCHKTEDKNIDDVARYVKQFPVGRSFKCFYNTDTLNDAITHKVYTKSDVIHCLLWPLLVIAICAILFLCMELASRGLVRFPCGQKDKGSVAQSASPISCSSSAPH